MSIIIAIVLVGFFEIGSSQYLTNTVHKTPAAAEKVNHLWCYSCNATEDGEACVELSANNSSFGKKCFADEFICMVKQFSYTTHTSNSNVSEPKLWSLERKCINTCEPGCIIIGERTKLYACTSCCDQSLCNVGKAQSTNNFAQTSWWTLSLMGVITQYLPLLRNFR
ncbi:uncharacterized protein LOC129766056 [Toxorhynchites rutilus septentrionalis]|uniref:uncharacterized protein LOC129766056 n=1 Tax=Toxorhynchites rutilus septentrionalis TaxID=329112 RepID=UPI00247A1AB5|nr:uncharacterized protein LOC129766056 [Toxorhynchites rutilus septentrionalis]XP_055622485.1 uncharacterized protein LOC129766056 [Toxorhynchites rutilus septentrionalis]XP_055622486.1 uncharacterized protein LOC129766056 [Toxorhynchites rutilus septentrionalis]XP_055622487.1 uncharacterized protein LOC129766056 [Toxorhynchites rutilus septentrionalis]